MFWKKVKNIRLAFLGEAFLWWSVSSEFDGDLMQRSTVHLVCLICIKTQAKPYKKYTIYLMSM